MKKGNLLLGLVFIFGAIFIVANQLGYFPNVNAVKFVLTILFVWILVKGILYRSFGSIIFPIAFIGILYDRELGIEAITPWTILIAALLITIGVSLIFKNGKKHVTIDFDFDDMDVMRENIDIHDENRFKYDVSFGGCIKYIHSTQFEYGQCNSSFSGMKIFFDHAKMRDEKAVVEINATCSGIQVYVPKEWKVEDKMSVMMGGVEEKNRGNAETTSTLVLTGKVVLSGVEIIYV